jgi:hypothetical protein
MDADHATAISELNLAIKRRGDSGARVKMETGRCHPWRMDRDEVVRVLRAFEEFGLEDE